MWLIFTIQAKMANGIFVIAEGVIERQKMNKLTILIPVPDICDLVEKLL